MMKKPFLQPKNMFKLCLLLLVVLGVAACSKESEREICKQPQTVTLRLHTYQRDDSNLIDTVLNYPRLSVVNASGQLTTLGFGRTADLSLYLSPVSDTTVWFLQPDSNINLQSVRLMMVYDRQLKFISNACGYTYYYNLKEVFTENPIGIADSVVIENPEVTNNANVQHIRLYF